MNTTTIPSTKVNSVQRRRVGKVAGGAAGVMLAVGALAVGGAAPASAAGPVALSPWYTTSFPTWGWGSKTTFCVQNNSSSTSANVRINVTTGAGENVTARPGGSTCISRSWWGAPILIQNVGSSTVTVWTR